MLPKSHGIRHNVRFRRIGQPRIQGLNSLILRLLLDRSVYREKVVFENGTSASGASRYPYISNTMEARHFENRAGEAINKDLFYHGALASIQ
jgi:hypothetical protein